MKNLLIAIMAMTVSGFVFADANNNYQSCLVGNSPNVLKCQNIYVDECIEEKSKSHFGGQDCSVIPVMELKPELACGLYITRSGHLIVRDIGIEGVEDRIPTIIFQEIDPLIFEVIEYVDANGVKHISR